jgi:hypothetical protein
MPSGIQAWDLTLRATSPLHSTVMETGLEQTMNYPNKLTSDQEFVKR